jgi:DNA-binding LacI/PurR family transcriptional regulator
MARPLVIPLSGPQRAEIILRASVSASTILRAYRGTEVSTYSLRRITEAARALGYPTPPIPQKQAA